MFMTYYSLNDSSNVLLGVALIAAGFSECQGISYPLPTYRMVRAENIDVTWLETEYIEAS